MRLTIINEDGSRVLTLGQIPVSACPMCQSTRLLVTEDALLHRHLMIVGDQVTVESVEVEVGSNISPQVTCRDCGHSVETWGLDDDDEEDA